MAAVTAALSIGRGPATATAPVASSTYTEVTPWIRVTSEVTARALWSHVIPVTLKTAANAEEGLNGIRGGIEDILCSMGEGPGGTGGGAAAGCDLCKPQSSRSP